MSQFLSMFSPLTQVAQASSAELNTFVTGAAFGGALVGALVAVMLVALAFVALVLVGQWHVFKKMGMPGWVSLVPFYNTVKNLEYTNLPLWWIFLMVVPFVNIVLMVILLHRTAVVFGKGWWFTVGMILLPFIFFPILGFDKSTYKNNYAPAAEMTKQTQYALIAAFVFAVLFLGGSSESRFARPLQVMGDGYAKDSMYVYHFDQVLADADPQSFQADGSYGFDRHTAYFEGEEIYGSDGMTFKILTNGWAKDENNVYASGNVLEGADPQTFGFFEGDKETYYVKDAMHVYTYDGVLMDADVATFMPMPYTYAKDRNHVFYEGKVMAGADAATFELVDHQEGVLPYEAKDKSRFYLYGKVVDAKK